MCQINHNLLLPTIGFCPLPPPKKNEQTCCKDHLSMFFRPPPHYQSCNIILLRKCFACPSKINNCISKINCTAIRTVVKLYMCLVQWIQDMQLFFFFLKGRQNIFEAEYQCNHNNEGGGTEKYTYSSGRKKRNTQFLTFWGPNRHFSHN